MATNADTSEYKGEAQTFNANPQHQSVNQGGGAGGQYKGQAQSFNASPQHQILNQAGGLHNSGIRIIANPGPAGLFGFASTTLLLSFVNVQTRGVTVPNIVLGMALAFGGLVQLLAGMWEFAAGNTFGATAFSGYGAFWLSYALIFIPGTNVAGAYTDQAEFGHAVGLYLATWFIFTFIHTVAALRSNVALFLLFFFLSLTFLLLTVAQFVTDEHVGIAGGALGIITAFIAYYAGASQLLTPEQSYVRLPLVDLPKHRDV